MLKRTSSVITSKMGNSWMTHHVSVNFDEMKGHTNRNFAERPTNGRLCLQILFQGNQ